jgi:hypothetical protein
MRKKEDAMSQAATLPAGWANILDDIRRHLDDAVAATDARLAKMPIMAAESPANDPQPSLAEICQRLHGLRDHLRSAEQVIEATDQVLQTEESQLQQHQAACRSLPPRLADWAAGRGAR